MKRRHCRTCKCELGEARRIPARRDKPRAGRVRDREFLAWMVKQPPLVEGPGRLTLHHVRRTGEPKNDRRTLPLPQSRHQLTHEIPGEPCIERGKALFERTYGVNIESSILEYNARYQAEKENNNGSTL